MISRTMRLRADDGDTLSGSRRSEDLHAAQTCRQKFESSGDPVRLRNLEYESLAHHIDDRLYLLEMFAAAGCTLETTRSDISFPRLAD